MKKILMTFIFSIVLAAAYSVAEAQNSEIIVNQIIQHYNKRNYKEALALLHY